MRQTGDFCFYNQKKMKTTTISLKDFLDDIGKKNLDEIAFVYKNNPGASANVFNAVIIKMIGHKPEMITWDGNNFAILG
jgi:hypothetical protein